MNTISINTPQNVVLEYKSCSLGPRIAAFLIDLLVMVAYFIGMGMLIGFFDNIGRLQLLALQNLVLLPVFFYSLLMNIAFNGRTVGKFALGLKTVKMDGSPVHLSDLLILWMLRLVDIWVVSPAVGVLSIAFTDTNQRLGGLASNTVVIDMRRKTKIDHTILERVDEGYEVQYPMVDMLSDEQVNDIKEIYRQTESSRDYHSLQMLADRLREMLNVKTDQRDAIFIRTVLKDYYYLTQRT